jgi:predicted metalloprotease with PDZ domain
MHRSLSLIISIELAILTVLPVAASSSSSTYVSSNKQPQQYGLVNDNQFACPVIATASIQGQSVTQTRVNLNTKTAQFQANHGQQLIGRVGLQVNEESGIIKQIYSHSHLREYGIQEGDRLIALNGNQIDGIGFTNSYLGRPGDFVNLTFERKELYKTVRVQLVDAAILKCDNIDFQRWANQERIW